MRSNTTYRSSTIIFDYALQHVSALQINCYQVDIGFTKVNIKIERPVFTVLWIVTVLFQERN